MTRSPMAPPDECEWCGEEVYAEYGERLILNVFGDGSEGWFCLDCTQGGGE